MITQAELHQLLAYNPETGHLTWLKRVAKNVKEGQIAGSLQNSGYYQIKILGEMYLLHRIIWLHVYGKWPNLVDHINGIKTDNRLCNLRNVTANQNQFNARISSTNTSGVKGVTWHKVRNAWMAQIRINSINKFIGYFDSLEAAEIAIKKARLHYHGEFANHG